MLEGGILRVSRARGETIMKQHRWLLPFTHDVDVRAIKTAVQLAQADGALLVPVALIAVPHGPRSSGVRLEHIEEAKDFLVIVQEYAAKHQVQVECHEVYTTDIGKCLTKLWHDLHGDSLIMIFSGQQSVLLHREEFVPLLRKAATSFVIIRLPGPQIRRRLPNSAIWNLFKTQKRFRPQERCSG